MKSARAAWNVDFAARSRRRGERGDVAALRRTSDDEGNAEIAHNSTEAELDSEGCPQGEAGRPSQKRRSSYRRPRTSCISYSPGFCLTTHLAARAAPRENMSRVWARWVISILSPMPMK